MKQAGIVLVALFLFWGSGCTRSSEASDTPQKVQTATTVARIAFLDQEQCCKCTRERTEKSWAALQVALGDNKIPVERIHVDSQEAAAETYRKLRPYQVIPAVYFLGANSKLIEMLQGELDEEAIKKLLKTPE